jgi:hypothetical protein
MQQLRSPPLGSSQGSFATSSGLPEAARDCVWLAQLFALELKGRNPREKFSRHSPRIFDRLHPDDN